MPVTDDSTDGVPVVVACVVSAAVESVVGSVFRIVVDTIAIIVFGQYAGGSAFDDSFHDARRRLQQSSEVGGQSRQLQTMRI